MTLLLALAMTADVPPPRGINNAVLGKAEAFRTDGPARVCMVQSSIDLKSGETAYLDYMGIHYASIRVVGRRGEYLIREGNNLLGPSRRAPILTDDRGRKLVQAGSRGKPGYWIYARLRDWDGDLRPMVSVSGKPFTRVGGDRILERITVHPGDPPGCGRRYLYGWFFEEEAEEEK